MGGGQSISKSSGPQLFNCLPPFLRNMTKCSVDILKEELDKYLLTIPDEPSVPGLTPDARPSNSLLHQRPMHPGREERRGSLAKLVATQWQLKHDS